MDEASYLKLTFDLYNRVIKAFESIDPDQVEASFHLDNITLTFADGVIFIINRQTPVQQIWLATKKKGLHFNYSAFQKVWLSDHQGEEFYSFLAKSIFEKINIQIVF